MKIFDEYLSKLEHKLEHAEEIIVEEHALNLTPRINRASYTLGEIDKKILEMREVGKIDKYLAVAVEHFKSTNEINNNRVIAAPIQAVLSLYNNRTIHIENENPDYSGLVKHLESCNGVDFAANHKHCLFEPLDIGMWQKHSPRTEERMALYAFDTKHKGSEKKANEITAIESAAKFLGTLATKKRKRYNQYESMDYIIASKDGLHARPASYIASFMKKLQGDAWIRTESMEVNLRSIMGLLMLAATKDKRVTILYKPKADAESFFKGIESLEENSEKILKRALRKTPN